MRMRPCVELAATVMARLCSSVMPSSVRLLARVPGSSTRMIKLSPSGVDVVASRILNGRPAILTSQSPSWGLRRSAISIPPSALSRDINMRFMSLLIDRISRISPSTRKRITASAALGSM